MKFAEFILQNMEAILAEWEQFAKTIPIASEMDTTALRDDAEKILRTIAYEMQLEQSTDEQRAKSRGMKDRLRREDSAAETHARDRLASGFELAQMAAEYRALRASVIHLWSQSRAKYSPNAIYELTRFNEGIDQALTESLARFSQDLDRSRALFMGVLGHDLRNPVQVIHAAAKRLQESDDKHLTPAELAGYILENTDRITRMLDDLLDVTRTKLGRDMPLQAAPADLAPICHNVVASFRQLHPGCAFELLLEDNLQGVWDGPRIEQMISNLLRNAVQYGDRSHPIKVRASAAVSDVVLTVNNRGAPIPPAKLPLVFEPLIRGLDTSGAPEPSMSMGLGLHIACTIARAHGGSIKVDSSWDAGTTFTVTLPRTPA